MGDLWEQVATIRCPVLIVRGGESDILAPEVAARFGGIVGAEVRTVPGAGHSVMGDNPAGFLAAVEPFLAGSRRQREPRAPARSSSASASATPSSSIASR